jgi:hypothetical protein
MSEATESEKTFEHYLDSQKLAWDRVPETQQKQPDYRVEHNGLQRRYFSVVCTETCPISFLPLSVAGSGSCGSQYERQIHRSNSDGCIETPAIADQPAQRFSLL